MDKKHDIIVEKLLEYSSSCNYDDLPDEAISAAKRELIDTLGCAVAALNSPPCRIVRQFAGHAPTGSSSIIGSNMKRTPDLAAFVNGTMIRYLDFNDTYLSKEPAHPSDNISALLAVGEAEAVSGQELLAAAVLGYEVQCRLCDAASIRRHGWDHVTYGPISTAILSGKLLKLSECQLANAIAIAATPNVAIRQTRAGEISYWKAAAFANAARNGIFAAYIAKEGMQGPSDVFNGIFGFATLVSGELNLADFGDGGCMINRCSIKKYPAEYHSQTAINLAVMMRKNITDFNNIKEVQIYTFKTAVEIIGSGAERWHPQSRETADHSLPFIFAAALMDGTIAPDSFSEESIVAKQPFLEKISVIEDEKYNDLYPDGNPTRVVIRMNDGTLLDEEMIYPEGHAKNRMTDSQLFQKFEKNTGFDKVRSNRIIDMVMNLETTGPKSLMDELGNDRQ